jgi:hypothetical protein
MTRGSCSVRPIVRRRGTADRGKSTRVVAKQSDRGIRPRRMLGSGRLGIEPLQHGRVFVVGADPRWHYPLVSAGYRLRACSANSFAKMPRTRLASGRTASRAEKGGDNRVLAIGCGGHARTIIGSTPRPRQQLDALFLHISSSERDFDCGAPSVLAYSRCARGHGGVRTRGLGRTVPCFNCSLWLASPCSSSSL